MSNKKGDQEHPDEQPSRIVPLTTLLGKGRSSRSSVRHIVLLLDQFPAIPGGGERVVLRMASLLESSGFRVSIVTFQILCDLQLLQQATCPIYLLPVSNVFGADGLRGAWSLGRFLRQERAEIVMTFFESSDLFGGLVVKTLTRAKLVWNRRDMGILRLPKHRLAYRLLHRVPDHVIAVSEQVRRHTVKVDGIPSSRVTVIYNGQDVFPDSAVQQDSQPIVVTVGNLRHVKGQDILIDAAALVLKEKPDTRFLIAGEVLDAEYMAGLEQRISRLAIEKSITFLGNVSNPHHLLQRAAAFVLPSRSEGFSNAIVEAMLVGLPVVATSVGGNAEAVVDGATGWIVAPDDPHQLAAALLVVLREPDRARRMGDEGKKRAHALFTSAVMSRALVKVLNQL